MREKFLAAETGSALSRNPGIDALRGLAIVLVVFNHLGLRIPLHKTALAEVLPGWLLGAVVARGWSAPCERRLRLRLLGAAPRDCVGVQPG